MKGSVVFLFVGLLSPCVGQAPRAPNVEAQRAAMKKLDFVIGKWSGEARVQRGPGQALELIQTEEAQYKLDGLVLLIEGTGRNRSDGRRLSARSQRFRTTKRWGSTAFGPTTMAAIWRPS